MLRRLEFHDTPKHASWLNMVEIEIAAWQRQRNHSGARIKWMFTIDKARRKMARAHPETPRDMASQIKES